MKSPSEKLHIAAIGYSTRSLAEAIASLGHRVLAVDCFCDVDTVRVAQCIAIDSWPTGIQQSLDGHDIDSVLLAGGMENHPKLITGLTERGLLLGIGPAAIAYLRCVDSLQNLVSGTSISFPDTSRIRPSGDLSNWIWKPFASGGGSGIRAATHSPNGDSGYWQKFVVGKCFGAYLILSELGAHFVGAVEALDQHAWRGPFDMIYRGSMGPVHVSSTHRRALIELAEKIRQATNYAGWLQMDFIESPDGRLYLLEINPRWTAGMEVIRLSGLCNLVETHLNAVGAQSIAQSQARSTRRSMRAGHDAGAPQPKSWVAKAIYYARSEFTFRMERAIEMLRLAETLNQHKNSIHMLRPQIDIADIPVENSVIEAHQPAFTIRAWMPQAGCPWPEARRALLGLLQDIQPLCDQIFDRPKSE